MYSNNWELAPPEFLCRPFLCSTTLLNAFAVDGFRGEQEDAKKAKDKEKADAAKAKEKESRPSVGQRLERERAHSYCSSEQP